MVESYKDNDYLNLKSNTKVSKLIRDEILLCSLKVDKLNSYGFKMTRVLVITNKALYNLKTNISLRRRVAFKDIQGISVSKYTLEFIIHCEGIEHDLWFITDHRNLIIELLAQAYLSFNFFNLKLCELENKTLKDYVTSKKEKYKDLSFTKMPKKFISCEDFLLGNPANIDVGELVNKTLIEGDDNLVELKRKSTITKYSSNENLKFSNFQVNHKAKNGFDNSDDNRKENNNKKMMSKTLIGSYNTNLSSVLSDDSFEDCACDLDSSIITIQKLVGTLKAKSD